MSYILEALRRAEGERPPAPPSAPQPAAAQEDAVPVLRKLRALPLPAQAALAGAGAAVVVLLLASLLRPTREPAAPAAAEAIAPAAASAQVLPAAPDRPTLTSMDDLIESDPGTPPALAAELLPMEPEEFADAPADPSPPAGITPTEEPPPQTSIRTVELEPAPPSAVTPLREMPEDFRAAFPPFKIEVHAYDPDPALRFVLIEGRRYREGETLAQGPQLTEITANGVVFSFRGSEVLLPASY